MPSLSPEHSAPPKTSADQQGFQLLDPRVPGPIREELLGMVRLEGQARRLASVCELAPYRRVRSPLLRRFFENGRVLVRAHREILERDQPEIRGTDADWLADNYHIVEEALREVHLDFPRGYDAILPKLGVAPLAGYPRIYALALTLVAHTDSELDETRILRFVQAFQEVIPLTIGELWALPIMLRVVVIENLRRLAEQMMWRWNERLRAESLHKQSKAHGDESRLADLVTRRELEVALPKDLSDAFVVRLLQLLRDQGPAASATMHRLEVGLSARGDDADEIIRREHQRHAANRVSVGNCVLSLRLLAAVDWKAFFENCSLVERILRDDPSGAYPIQDFTTSDRYRKAVERIARGSNADELEVARMAIDLARRNSSSRGASSHVGFFLIDRGEAALREAFRYKPDVRERILAWVLGHPRIVYFGSISVLLGILLALVARALLASEARVSWPWVWLTIIVALLPASELTVGFVNHLLTLFLPPRTLPKLEFKNEIPEEFATFVVIPSMLTQPRSAELLCERLESHYLSNPTPGVCFALLTDFADAQTQTMPGDQNLIDDALERVRALNHRYAAGRPDLFFLFHRQRMWNPSENCWMGWERKRGKLGEFNRLLHGSLETTYTTLSSNPEDIPRARFVVTLDADTQAPRDTVGRLVGALAHPLNQPRFDPGSGLVVEGYGVLQPRVSFHLTAATHSTFAALLAASGGIDPYSTAASDAYMDLFGLGSFTGKGIYDVEAFEAATGSTFPENHILSHDLIEGNYARCGLLSDTEVFDDFPARYHAYARREHRWARGDWQLLPWIGPIVPVPDGKRTNPLLGPERWKLFDNLRRHLVPPALVLLLILGWTALPTSPWFWSVLAIVIVGMPLLKWLLAVVIGFTRTGSLLGFRAWRERFPALAGQSMLTAVLLAHQAILMCDAAVRTLARVFITRRRMLEWETAASTEQRLGARLQDFAAGMWGAPALALTIMALVALVRPSSVWAAGLYLAGWLASPVLAFWISRPRPTREAVLRKDEQNVLRRISRKTWLFFEKFVGDESHWLPPDNFQEVPDGRLAHRTSPTNQGLLLLSTLAAHDMGYLSMGKLVERLQHTIQTLERMERHWGHFYNWYDTRTLQPLPPQYISTVDSGNLLGCLLTLKQGLREKTREPLWGPAIAAGLTDTFLLVDESWRRNSSRLEACLHTQPDDLVGWDDWLQRLEDEASELLRLIAGPNPAPEHAGDPSATYACSLLAQIRDRRAELAALAPWLVLLRALEQQGESEAGTNDERPGWLKQLSVLKAPGSLEDLVSRIEQAIALRSKVEDTPAGVVSLDQLDAALQASAATGLRASLLDLANRAEALGAAMDFRPLYKPERHLFAIGANLSQGHLDGACYDLLASESCLTSYLAVARGDAPRRHWFQLARPYIRSAGRMGLISWGGTMFEYVMPRLLLRTLPRTLLSEACRTAVASQIQYGQELGIPWGMSESAYNAQYQDGDYRYQSFGVPELGLKRGLDRDRVVAPYAAALATMIAPHEAIANLQRISREGAEGPFGFYEAIDYTFDRLGRHQRLAVVKTYMAHHQGMILVALTNVLRDDLMSRRFHSDPMVRAAELLLQERIPPKAPLVQAARSSTSQASSASSQSGRLLSRRLTTPFTAAPRSHLLSNNRYHVMVTNAGSGYSKCQGLDLTRWRADPTCETWGFFIYVRDLKTDEIWSGAHQPACRAADEYEVVFSLDKAAFRRRDVDVATTLEITVSPEELAEVRRVTLTNHSDHARELELTSYLEPVLNWHMADLTHPAFSKLFFEAEYVPASESLLGRRRPRSRYERGLWIVHTMAADASAPGHKLEGEQQFEMDRARFVGRGHSLADPAALSPGANLSAALEPGLDPIFSLRRRLKIAPGGSAVIGFALAVADSRGAALALADKYHSISAVARAFELAWAHSQVEHAESNRTAEEVHLYQRFASTLIFPYAALRARSHAQPANREGQRALWRFGLSSDRPIALVQIAEPSELSLARQVLDAHSYLKRKGLDADLVLLGNAGLEDAENLNEQTVALIRDAGFEGLMNQPGGVFVIHRVDCDDDLLLIQKAAHLVLDGARGSFAAQLDRVERTRSFPEPIVASRSQVGWHDGHVCLPPDLRFFNGVGGFTEDSSEYCMLISDRNAHRASLDGQVYQQQANWPHLPPAPWVNVIANPEIGFIVSESGSGFTWSGNSQMNRLTPWNNDPVADPPGEVVYVRDEQSGRTWCPTPLPIASHGPTLVRHGQGYTVFERNTHGIENKLTVLVSATEPVKLLRLEVRNPGPEPRQLSATFYAELVLGTMRDSSAMHVVTELDPETGALLARNAFRLDFAHRVTFFDVNRRPRTVTGNRDEFLGRHGSVAAPAALTRARLSGTVGAELDPCAAIQTHFELGPSASVAIVFLLGEAETLENARTLVRRFSDPEVTEVALKEVRDQWDRVLGTVNVQTPDPAFDLLLNRWLLYQVLSCRIWARSALYQSGGAFGFRDQLQDVMALFHAAGDIARAHILHAASRQFVEGDVQHWWHPPSGRGVRTRISDDFLWLPYVTASYVKTTGDTSILDEVIPFLKAPLLLPGQQDDFRLPEVAEESGSLYEHCVRALERGIARLGVHGLPLMGSGDWNDGMNRVGIEGRGESVWLAWFLVACLRDFSQLAETRDDPSRVSLFRERAAAICSTVERHAWDGSWYLRAICDDGTVLGSVRHQECQIDSVAQTWAVISDAADPHRRRLAMDAVRAHLVCPNDRLILLLTPAFDDGSIDPGYIKGYLPGVRENGAQYTHAAAWVVRAAAELGLGRIASELFSMLNPICHTRDPEEMSRYQAEPYVLAGDVLSRTAQRGRGGWTWYTGSAAWIYRVGLESILGVQRSGKFLTFRPCIPPDWKSFEVCFRYRSTTYRIVVENPEEREHGVVAVSLDGYPCADLGIELIDDGAPHEVAVRM
jgi:cyclic beta-1,2-glucan synthetase